MKTGRVPYLVRALGIAVFFTLAAVAAFPTRAQHATDTDTAAAAVAGRERPDTSGPAPSPSRDAAASIAPRAEDSTHAVTARRESEPVIFRGDTVFLVHSPLGEFVARERADQVSEKLRILARSPLRLDSLRLVRGIGVIDVLLDTLRVLSVTGEDAAAEGLSGDSLASLRMEIVKKAVRERRSELSLQALLRDTGLTVLALALALAAIWVMAAVFPRLVSLVRSLEGKLFRSLRMKGRTIVEAGTVTGLVATLVTGVRLALTLAVLYFTVSYILSILPWTREWDPAPLLQGLLWGVLVTGAALALWRGGRAFFEKAGRDVESWRGKYIRALRFRTVEVVSEDRLVAFSRTVIRLARFAAAVFLAYVYVSVVFSLFDFSKTWSATLFGYVLGPLNSIVVSFVNYIPSLFFVLVVVVVTRYLIKLIRAVFMEVGKGAISFPGFHAEWADPTFKIVRFLVFWLAAVVIFPYLPGSDSPAFQGVTVFLGILFSLGSTSAIANMVGGIVLTYMRPFKVGDRVKIADTTGDVIERTLLVTRVRTIKNVDITIPNAMVLGSHIINFSSSASDRGLILHASVTIGYDVPWKTVHQLLLAAADRTSGFLKDPKPFVYQTALEDSYVQYELNAYTGSPNSMAATYSELHQHIQDVFNEGGVEIMSPHYSAVRDGNQTTIPETYLPSTYRAPGFRIFPLPPGGTAGEPGAASGDPSRETR